MVGYPTAEAKTTLLTPGRPPVNRKIKAESCASTTKIPHYQFLVPRHGKGRRGCLTSCETTECISTNFAELWQECRSGLKKAAPTPNKISLPFLPTARGLEKGSTAPNQFPSAGMDNGRGLPEGNREQDSKNAVLL